MSLSSCDYKIVLQKSLIISFPWTELWYIFMNFLTIIRSLDFLFALTVITFHHSNMVGKMSLKDIFLYHVCTVQTDNRGPNNKMRQVRMFFSLVKLEKTKTIHLHYLPQRTFSRPKQLILPQNADHINIIILKKFYLS